MAEDCGGTPVFEVVLQICWSMRKTPVQSVNVSDDYATSLKSGFRVCWSCNVPSCGEGQAKAVLSDHEPSGSGMFVQQIVSLQVV